MDPRVSASPTPTHRCSPSPSPSLSLSLSLFSLSRARILQEGNHKLVKILIECGSDVDAQGILGRTPLHNACHFGHEKVVHRLLLANADPGLKTEPQNRDGAWRG